MIDQDIARRVAEALGGGPGDEALLPLDLIAMVERSTEAVVAYTGLRPTQPLPSPEAVGRPAWREANLAGMDALLAPLAERLGEGAGPFAGPVRAAGGALVGAEAGALVGYLGRRVLGQYDLRLLDRSVAARLLFVVPNLRSAAEELDADLEQLVAWVCLHEVTHAVQFGSVGWLQDHVAGLLTRMLDGLNVKIDPSALLKLPTGEDLKVLVGALREGSLVSLVAGREKAETLDAIQATMALIEGHAEHVMDAASGGLVRDLPALRAALDRRRRERPPVLSFVERLIGMDLKMRQYEQGKAFCDGVVAEGGVAALHRAFAAPGLLPSLAELGDPAAWLARTRPGELDSAA